MRCANGAGGSPRKGCNSAKTRAAGLRPKACSPVREADAPNFIPRTQPHENYPNNPQYGGVGVMDSPHTYARHLATYIASPTKIESLTRIEFGEAPALHTIANMRFAVEREDRKFKRPHRCKDSERADGDDYVLPSLLRQSKPPQKPRVMAAIDFTPNTAEPPENPFLQPWRLSRAVVESVARDFGLCAAHVAGKSRCREYVWARAVAIRLLNERGMSAAGIGRKLGRDHSTILHSLENYDVYASQCVRVDAVYRRHLRLIEDAERERAD